MFMYRTLFGVIRADSLHYLMSRSTLIIRSNMYVPKPLLRVLKLLLTKWALFLSFDWLRVKFRKI